MTTLGSTASSVTESTTVRHALRNVTALAGALGLTAAVLVSLSTLVGTWA